MDFVRHRGNTLLCVSLPLLSMLIWRDGGGFEAGWFGVRWGGVGGGGGGWRCGQMGLMSLWCVGKQGHKVSFASQSLSLQSP